MSDLLITNVDKFHHVAHQLNPHVAMSSMALNSDQDEIQVTLTIHTPNHELYCEIGNCECPHIQGCSCKVIRPGKWSLTHRFIPGLNLEFVAEQIVEWDSYYLIIQLVD